MGQRDNLIPITEVKVTLNSSESVKDFAHRVVDLGFEEVQKNRFSLSSAVISAASAAVHLVFDFWYFIFRFFIKCLILGCCTVWELYSHERLLIVTWILLSACALGRYLRIRNEL